jgi:hypothetical protein
MSYTCGHPERAHVGGGRCRVPDCPCERVEPGDTIAREFAVTSAHTPAHVERAVIPMLKNSTYDLMETAAVLSKGRHDLKAHFAGEGDVKIAAS